MRLVNLTSHELVVMPDGRNVVLRVPPSGTVARVVETRRPSAPLVVEGTSVEVDLVAQHGVTDDLPGPQEGVALVVSRMTAAAARHRRDLYFPLDEVRDHGGVIIGCRRLGTFADQELP